MVYEDAEKLYAEVARDGKALFKEAISTYLRDIIPLSSIIESQALVGNGRLVALNTVHHTRREVVEIPLVGPTAMRLKSEVVQISRDGSKGYALMDSEDNGGGFLRAKGIYADLQPSTGKYQWLFRRFANLDKQLSRRQTMNLF
jgi:alpha-mannosidase